MSATCRHRRRRQHSPNDPHFLISLQQRHSGPVRQLASPSVAAAAVRKSVRNHSQPLLPHSCPTHILLLVLLCHILCHTLPVLLVRCHDGLQQQRQSPRVRQRRRHQFASRPRPQPAAAAPPTAAPLLPHCFPTALRLLQAARSCKSCTVKALTRDRRPTLARNRRPTLLGWLWLWPETKKRERQQQQAGGRECAIS